VVFGQRNWDGKGKQFPYDRKPHLPHLLPTTHIVDSTAKRRKKKYTRSQAYLKQMNLLDISKHRLEVLEKLTSHIKYNGFPLSQRGMELKEEPVSQIGF